VAKGIKMVRAFKHNGNTKQVCEIEKLSKNDNGTIFCEDEICRTRIEYNSGYTREATNTKVAPYLRLAKDCVHKSGCKNSVSGAVKVFVRDSNNVENIQNIFDELANGHYTFRLNLVEQSQKQMNDLVKKITKEPNNEQLGSDFIKTNKKLASYFKSASGIARLRSLILENDGISEFEALVKIQYQDKEIKWKDFFYDDERYHVLYNRLLKGEIDHPVALRLTVKSTRSSSVENSPISIKCYSENKDGSSYTPWINLHKELATLELTPNKPYIILASVNTSENGIFKNIKISINNKNQIVSE